MTEEHKHIGYIERAEGFYNLYAPIKGQIVTKAFILCKYCKSTIYPCAGPKYNAVCFTCYDNGAHNEYVQTVDSNEKASAFMDARLWEFIDMAAMWPRASPDSRIWDHVMVYAPKQPVQEPVAWRFRTGTFWNREMRWRYLDSLEGTKGLLGLQPLYAAPQKKEWVGLTDEEIGAVDWKSNETLHDYARSIELKLRDKNA